jgi:hypothetical protein
MWLRRRSPKPLVGAKVAYGQPRSPTRLLGAQLKGTVTSSGVQHLDMGHIEGDERESILITQSLGAI